MDSTAFIARTKAYSLRIIRLIDSLPKDDVARTLGHQLLWLAARSAQIIGPPGVPSPAPISSRRWQLWRRNAMRPSTGWNYWSTATASKRTKVALLKQEGVEILSMVVASIRTAKSRR